MTVLRITLDTTELDTDRLDALNNAVDVPAEFAEVTVSRRERGTPPSVTFTTVSQTAVWGEPVPEGFVLDESNLDEAVLPGENDAEVFERTLEIISNGAFPAPGKRKSLSLGQEHQFRDAMIFEAHVRECRHVLVTGDRKAFINDGRRERLQALGRTWIVTWGELSEMASRGELGVLLDPPECT